MFAILGFDEEGSTDETRIPMLSVHVGRDHYYELIEQAGIVPAPYLARAHWVLLENWHELSTKELTAYLTHAYSLIYARLPKATKIRLELQSVS